MSTQKAMPCGRFCDAAGLAPRSVSLGWQGLRRSSDCMFMPHVHSARLSFEPFFSLLLSSTNRPHSYEPQRIQCRSWCLENPRLCKRRFSKFVSHASQGVGATAKFQKGYFHDAAFPRNTVALRHYPPVDMGLAHGSRN